MAAQKITGYDPTSMQWAEIQVSAAEDDAPAENECLQTLIRLRQQRQARQGPKMSAKVDSSPSLQQARLIDAASAEYVSALPSSERNTHARWRPAQTPRVLSEEKPRSTQDVRKVFRHGDAVTASVGYITGVCAESNMEGPEDTVSECLASTSVSRPQTSTSARTLVDQERRLTNI
ncbi:hypothetical protein MRX96_026028 [Rhipicephalus microplus]